MLRIGVPAAIEPRKKAITRSFCSILRANKHGSRFIFVSSSKFQATQEAAPREQCGSRFEKGWCEMKTKELIAATLAASMAVAAVPTMSHAAIIVPGHTFSGGSGFAVWPIFACAGGIITSALVANYRDNRELTALEAWTCGVAFWFAQPGKHKKGRH